MGAKYGNEKTTAREEVASPDLALISAHVDKGSPIPTEPRIDAQNKLEGQRLHG